MESDAFGPNVTLYPVLLLPKTCTTLETNCEASDNVFIHLNITSRDTEDKETCIYSGLCNVNLIENYDVNIPVDVSDQGLAGAATDGSGEQIAVLDTGNSYPPYSQSQVWIDPARSPYVYNSCNTAEAQECHSVYQSHTNRITVEQHNTYITQNVYNSNDFIHHSPANEFEHKKFRKNQTDPNHNSIDQNVYDDDEFECGVFLSKLPEEILNEKEIRAREELKYVGLQSDNDALKQLMSSDIQSVSKQQKTILFLGHDSHYGQTIQKIAINDPYLECAGFEQREIGNDEPIFTRSSHKKYQCDKCKQIFNQISEFKQHMIGNHKSPKVTVMEGAGEVKFMCLECGKNLKNQDKFELHCLGHGDPDLECNKCHKVFASKFTLRTHKKIHYRKHPCKHCTKAYSNVEELKAHAAKIHTVLMCDLCAFTADDHDVLKEHKLAHAGSAGLSGDADLSVSLEHELISDGGMLTPVPDDSELGAMEPDVIELDKHDEISQADSIIAKVVANEIFLHHSRKTKQRNKYRNSCDVCQKTFDRVGDLKRHLIEHVVRSTLAKNPVNRHGVLNIVCEICRVECFTKIDKYKAHLREHAKVTLYKCTFCDKSFSDSSNFSKHKKIHGTTYFQCDLCQRKFNSKKMIEQHMEYHSRNSPVQCEYCDKEFHFESMLNKHIRGAHTKHTFSRFRCRFCYKYFRTLKEKWDHEWTVHNVRKMIIDCRMCGAKFRKYSELKRHCTNLHDMDIPPTKVLLKKRRFT